jgi:hypothetical protein
MASIPLWRGLFLRRSTLLWRGEPAILRHQARGRANPCEPRPGELVLEKSPISRHLHGRFPIRGWGLLMPSGKKGDIYDGLFLLKPTPDIPLSKTRFTNTDPVAPVPATGGPAPTATATQSNQTSRGSTRQSHPAKPGPAIHDNLFFLSDTKPVATSDPQLLNYLRTLFGTPKSTPRSQPWLPG